MHVKAIVIFILSSWVVHAHTQSVHAIDQVVQLLDEAKNNFKNISGKWDEKRRVWNTTFQLDGTTENWLFLDTTYGFSFFQARLTQEKTLNKAKDVSNVWVELLRKGLDGFGEKHIPTNKGIFNKKYDEYIFHRIEGAYQFVVKVEIIKRDDEDFFKSSLTVWRKWGTGISNYQN